MISVWIVGLIYFSVGLIIGLVYFWYFSKCLKETREKAYEAGKIVGEQELNMCLSRLLRETEGRPARERLVYVFELLRLRRIFSNISEESEQTGQEKSCTRE